MGGLVNNTKRQVARKRRYFSGCTRVGQSNKNERRPRLKKDEKRRQRKFITGYIYIYISNVMLMSSYTGIMESVTRAFERSPSPSRILDLWFPPVRFAATRNYNINWHDPDFDCAPSTFER